MTTLWNQGNVQMWKVVKEDGFMIFFRGWDSIFSRQVVTWVTYLLAYDYFRETTMKRRKDKPLNVWDKIFIGSATGFVACLLNTPFDMFKTQAQKDSPLKKNAVYISQLMFKQHGVSGIYSSFIMRFLRSTWYSVTTLLVMDYFNALPARMKLSNQKEVK
eukprot:TRINITY_DN15898_c0_g1_i1.p1 TRINITY_DN15898_c0_g1~~TRINITY_DN15898_c0_g1_i1.p1  ORF type:complete len:160 (-),score=16.26 TRINITY_DN15898_c0_g1_i1:15-494(-)